MKPIVVFAAAVASFAVGFGCCEQALAQTSYKQPITGDPAKDAPYKKSAQAGEIHYLLAPGATIEVSSAALENAAVKGSAGAPPIVLDLAQPKVRRNNAAPLTLACARTAQSADESGRACGIEAENNVTVNGPCKIYAIDNKDFPNGHIRANAFALWAKDAGQITINGDVLLDARTKGYAKVVHTSGRGQVTINGNLTAKSLSNNTDYAINMANDGGLVVHGDVDLSAVGPRHSDNVNGIWIEGVIKSHVTIDKNFKLYCEANGSTVQCIRDNGVVTVGGKTEIEGKGSRTVIGVNAENKRSSTNFKGPVTIKLQGGVNVRYGDTVGAHNNGGNGDKFGHMFFEDALAIEANSTGAHALGIANSGVFEAKSPRGAISAKITTTAKDKDAVGITNSGSLAIAEPVTIAAYATPSGTAYGIRTTAGAALFAGPVAVTELPNQAGTTYALAAQTDNANSNLTINPTGAQSVKIDGPIGTSSSGELKGVLNLRLGARDSYINGNVVAIGGAAGEANILTSNGGVWKPSNKGRGKPNGAGMLKSDFGSGTLTLGEGGILDMAGAWGDFAPGAAPPFACRTLTIDSSDANAGATAHLADGAIVRVVSDLGGRAGAAAADKIVFGAGVKKFAAGGAQQVAIAYDPLLDDPSWLQSPSVRTGAIIIRATPAVIIDATAAASGAADFSAVRPVTGRWRTAAGVPFNYTPQLSLSEDRKQVLLTGFTIVFPGEALTLGIGKHKTLLDIFQP